MHDGKFRENKKYFFVAEKNKENENYIIFSIPKMKMFWNVFEMEMILFKIFLKWKWKFFDSGGNEKIFFW